MQEFLSKSFYHNTIGEWLIALGLIVLSVIVGRVLFWVFKNIIKPLTAKSKTKLDDIFIDLCEEPISLAIVLVGIWHSLKLLHMTEYLGDMIGKGFYIAIIFNIAWLVVRLSDAVVQEYLVPLTEKTDNDLDDQLLPILKKGMRVIIWAIALVVGLNNAGYNVGALLAGLGVGGLAFALAAKDTVANLFGGLTVLLDKPFKMGDRIQIKGFDGTVVEIGLRSSRIQTLDGRIVTIPNADFASDPIQNVSSEPSRKVTLNLGLTYDTTPDQVKQAIQTLKEIAANNSSLDEKVILSFNAFGDFALNIMFIYYIKKGEDIAQTQTDIDLEILSQFNEQGLEFAFPTQTIYKKELP